MYVCVCVFGVCVCVCVTTDVYAVHGSIGTEGYFDRLE